MIKLIKKIGIIVCFLLPLSAFSQKPDADVLLKQSIHEKNVNQDYSKAINFALQGLQASPTYTDIRLVLARLYVLTDSLEKARTELLYVLNTSPDNQDALLQLSDLESSQNNFKEALNYNRQALALDPTSAELRIKRVSLLRETGNLKDANSLIQQLATEVPDNEKYAELAKEIFIQSRRNYVAITYSNTSFERAGKDSWNLISAYYARQAKFGTLIGRINYADRAFAKGVQFELEAYPKHGKGSYSFVNLAYSRATIFPDFRFAYSYLTSLPKAWEAELGFRYQYNSGGTLSYTGSIGKYAGNYWFNFRTFLTPNEERISQSYSFTTRYYRESADNYFTFIAGTGISPDDRSRNFQISERFNLRSGRISLGYQRLIWSRNIIGILGTVTNEEYTPGKRENEFDILLNFQHRF